MDEVWTLILLSLAMLIGCYLSGLLPLTVTLSEDKLKLVTVLGAGLLVGTALAVIIPEGVHALLIQPELGHQHQSIEKSLEVNPKDSPHNHAHASGGNVASGQAGQNDPPHADDSHSAHTHEKSDPHSLIGVTLVLGFVFMLLVDQIGGNLHSRGSADNGRNRITATLGLVVHAAADGIALGAAASTSQTHVEMIVFVAIMLHKAPAAFGLVSFLLHEGMDRNRIRKHLGIFALSAPLMAVVTYFGLGQRSKEALSDINATGIAMLFSGGTFLYVATVHILPELANMRTTQSQCSTSSLPDGPVITHEHKGFTKLELTVMVIGCMLPLILAIGHSH